MDLNSKNIIVTGASSGIGATFSKKLIQKGATVYGLARRQDKLKNIQSELGAAFIPVEMDITDNDKLKAWVDHTFDENLRPDVLINNAGLGLFGDIDKLPVEEWEAMINTNLSAMFYITRLVVPLIKQNEPAGGRGHIINVCSIAGTLGNPQMSGYNASKFGVRGFSEALFKELRYDGIKVTCMNPGSINTHFFDKVEKAETHSNMMHPDEVAKVLVNILETAENFLINEITMRPLNPKPPAKK